MSFPVRSRRSSFSNSAPFIGRQAGRIISLWIRLITTERKRLPESCKHRVPEKNCGARGAGREGYRALPRCRRPLPSWNIPQLPFDSKCSPSPPPSRRPSRSAQLYSGLFGKGEPLRPRRNAARRHRMLMGRQFVFRSEPAHYSLLSGLHSKSNPDKSPMGRCPIHLPPLSDQLLRIFFNPRHFRPKLFILIFLKKLFLKEVRKMSLLMIIEYHIKQKRRWLEMAREKKTSV